MTAPVVAIEIRMNESCERRFSLAGSLMRLKENVTRIGKE